MLDLVTALWLGFIGACFGSFLNVVAYRMPRGMSVVWKPSHCPKCGHAIRPWHNVPIFGWLALRGRCRDCGGPISPRYAVVEAAMGAAFFALAYAELFSGGANLPEPIARETGALYTVIYPNWALIGLFAYHAFLLCLLMTLALIDQDGQRIPARLALIALVVAAAVSYACREFYPERGGLIGVDRWEAVFDACVGVCCGAAPWLIATRAQRLLNRPGRSKLARLGIVLALVGAYLGWQAAIRVTLLCLPLMAAMGAARRRGIDLGYVTGVWIATLLHLLFWRNFAAALSW